jgi:uncharacterized protein YciI
MPAADTTIGNCVILTFDSIRSAGSQAIEFQGPLDLVTIVESADYRTDQALPALDAAAASDAADVAKAAGSAAPTNLAKLSYGWNFKRQLRLQGGQASPAKVVNFVWRMSIDGMSEAEQDAWAPKDWVLALAGNGFARKVPIARGGYFLLPALPPGRQDLSLVFKDQGGRTLIDGAWVVRLREGQRPYLHYGEIGEAMNAVRKLQDAIPDGNAELATLREAHYDGLKACFLDGDGVVFVGDYPTADATVGNCKVVKFNPAQDVNERVEFIGKVDAVTMVDTAPYLQAGKAPAKAP